MGSKDNVSDSSLDCDHIPLFNEDDNEEEEEGDKETGDDQQSLHVKNGISESIAQKFRELQQRRESVTKQCVQREQRIEKRKKSSAKRRVRKHFATAEESRKDDIKDKAEEEWSSVRQYLDVNSHLHGPVGHGVRQPKCRLEENINEAIEKGEMEVAEQLSDKLATREFGVRAANAFAAKRFDQDKQEKKKKRLLNAKKKLHWGFETKQRWEMKGNM